MVRDNKLETEKETIDLVGEVIAVDTESDTGKLIIFENNHLAEDIYFFKLVSKISSRKLFKEAFLNEVRVACLKLPILDFIQQENKDKEGFYLKVKAIELL